MKFSGLILLSSIMFALGCGDVTSTNHRTQGEDVEEVEKRDPASFDPSQASDEDEAYGEELIADFDSSEEGLALAKPKRIPTGYKYEGIRFTALNVNSNGAPVYRAYNWKTGDHFYTTSARELGNAVKWYNYRFEGVAFKNGGDTKLYRLFNRTTGDHFYTASADEALKATKYYGYRYESDNMRVICAGACENGRSTINIHSFLGSRGDHFYSTTGY